MTDLLGSSVMVSMTGNLRRAPAGLYRNSDTEFSWSF